ncbi:MAG: cytochrome c maturation protein CcmE [Gammaproteobacteria bacterium]
MHPLRKRKLILITLMLLGISCAVGFALYALQQNINLFFTPSQILAGEAPKDQVFRLGGMVQAGSVHRDTKTLQVSFVVTDMTKGMTVKFQGILPDLFREGQGVVMDGKLGADNIFIAHEVLAKHDENYMPPQLKKALTPLPQGRREKKV